MTKIIKIKKWGFHIKYYIKYYRNGINIKFEISYWRRKNKTSKKGSIRKLVLKLSKTAYQNEKSNLILNIETWKNQGIIY